MADNVTITGTTIAADDISGVQYQRMKVVWGSDGTATDVSASNPLPVTGSLTVDSEFPASASLADATANPTTTKVASHTMVYNGTTWDRARGDITNGLAVDVTRVQGTVAVDSELPSAASLADSVSNPTVPSVGSFVSVYNGTNWDRVAGIAAATSAITKGAVHTSAVRYNGTDFSVDKSASNLTDSNAGNAFGGSADFLYNGSTFDRARNNVEGTLLASLIRSTTTNSPVQTNFNARGVIVYVNVSIPVAGQTLTPKLYFDDALSGLDCLVWTGASITASGLTTYAFYPGIAQSFDFQADLDASVSGVNQNASTYTETATGTISNGTLVPNNVGITDTINVPLPRSWWFQLGHSSTGDWTYSVSYSYIV